MERKNSGYVLQKHMKVQLGALEDDENIFEDSTLIRSLTKSQSCTCMSHGTTKLNVKFSKSLENIFFDVTSSGVHEIEDNSSPGTSGITTSNVSKNFPNNFEDNAYSNTSNNSSPNTPLENNEEQSYLKDVGKCISSSSSEVSLVGGNHNAISENHRHVDEFAEIEQLLADASSTLNENDQNSLIEVLEREFDLSSRNRHSSARSVASSSHENSIMLEQAGVMNGAESDRESRERSQMDSESEADIDDEYSSLTISIDRNYLLGRPSNYQREFADAIVRLAPLEELEHLLMCGASVTETVTQGLTPLHYAVWQRYPEAVELLIQKGCDLNARDDIGYTALHLCAEHGYLDMMKILLKHDAKVNINELEDGDLYPIDAVDEPLRLALKHDQMEAAKILLENHANPNSRYFFGSEINLVSPLKIELLKLLLSWGARPNTRDRYGFTPIMKACHVQQEAEEALVERETISGAEVLQHFAQTLKGIESVMVLISHGADINIRTDARHEFRSVLHYAILSGSSPIVNLLLKQGAKVNFEPEYNRASPLHLAVLKGDTNIINMLLDADAYINIITPTVGSPLHVACSENIPNRLEVLQLLLSRGANPNIVVRAESGRPLKPPLGEYLVNSTDPDLNVIKLLLKYGAQVIMKTSQQCPLGLLHCLYNVARNKEVMIELLEAAESFDIPLIRKSPLLVPSPYRDLFLQVAMTPQSLRQLCRAFLRHTMKQNEPEAVHCLDLPQIMKLYLLYEIS